jgi:hypothetical protein
VVTHSIGNSRGADRLGINEPSTVISLCRPSFCVKPLFRRLALDIAEEPKRRGIPVPIPSCRNRE